MKMLIRLKRTKRNVHHTPLKFNWTLFILFLIFFPACISYPSWNGAIMSMTWIFDVNNIVNSTHKFRSFFHVLCSGISEMTFDNVVHICAVLNKKLIVHLVCFVKNKKKLHYKMPRIAEKFDVNRCLFVLWWCLQCAK